jgi:peptidase M23-like protein
VPARLALTFLLFLLSFCASADASAYPWPVKPFDRQHPIRANFGDPRTRFWNTMLTDGLEGPGMFQFHNGIDIAAPEGTPVYPVVSGTATLIDETAVLVRTKDHRKFQYFHIIPTVINGDHVVARRSVIGYVMGAFEHVHLTEIRGRKVWNPVAEGGIKPYRDRTVPQIDSIAFRGTWSLLPLDTGHVCGPVSLVATAFDVPPLPVPGLFAGFPVSPALASWRLERIGGAVYVNELAAADFRTTLPSLTSFWNIYARGTFQNAPRFSNRQYFMAGRFVYNLAPFIDTRWYPDGVYEVSVRVRDMRGNESELAQQFTVENHTGAETGCPPQVPSSAP